LANSLHLVQDLCFLVIFAQQTRQNAIANHEGWYYINADLPKSVFQCLLVNCSVLSGFQNGFELYSIPQSSGK
jgi:hypothetical protein